MYPYYVNPYSVQIRFVALRKSDLRFFFVFFSVPVLRLTISILHAETPRVNVSE